MQGNPRTGIVMATMIEASPLIGALGLESAGDGPVRVFTAPGGPVLAVSGIGKVNAALAACYLVMRHDAGTMFNIGAAGATGLARSSPRGGSVGPRPVFDSAITFHQRVVRRTVQQPTGRRKGVSHGFRRSTPRPRRG